jgi:hypothetical protein
MLLPLSVISYHRSHRWEFIPSQIIAFSSNPKSISYLFLRKPLAFLTSTDYLPQQIVLSGVQTSLFAFNPAKGGIVQSEDA